MRSSAWHKHTNRSAFSGGANHLTVDMPKILSNWSGDSLSRLYPTHTWGTPQIFDAVGHRVVVGTRQVVIGYSLKVNGVVMAVGSTQPTGGFVERVGQKEVRTGQHPVAGVGDESVVARGT